MPLKLAWATDIHLNFAPPAQVEAFVAELGQGDAVLLTGDLAEATDVEAWLVRLADRLRRPLWFVLGNHDYYGGRIPEVRARITALCQDHPHLRWLPAAGVVHLSDKAALVGHDGWGDARNGDFMKTPVRLNDHVWIDGLNDLPRAELRRRLQALGDESAAHLRAVLPAALAQYPAVIVATHVPPFVESCWHEGRTSTWEWTADFSNQAAGAALLEMADAFPDREILVLCGHTHGQGEATLRPNLRVWTGGAEYGEPALQRLIEVA